MEEKEYVCEVVFESVYVPRKSDATIPITFKNMIYHRSFKDKLGLFWNWIKNKEGLSFKEWLEKPRKLETEWIYIEIKNENENNN